MSPPAASRPALTADDPAWISLGVEPVQPSPSPATASSASEATITISTPSGALERRLSRQTLLESGLFPGRITTEVEITQVMCKAELWEVCRPQPAPGETTDDTIKERKLGVVGGGATAVTDILNVEFEYYSNIGYDPDDEVPV